MIIESENDYIGALKGNQSGLLKAVETYFQSQETCKQINKGHGIIEKRTVSISHQLDNIPDFPGKKTLIRVQSERHVHRANIVEVSHETRSACCLLPGSCTSLCRTDPGLLGS